MSTLRQYLRHLHSRPSLVIVLSGFLAGGVFAAGWPGWMLPILLLPWLYYASLPSVDWRQGLWLTTCFFLPFHGMVLSWFLDTNVSGLIGASPHWATFAQAFSWLVMTIVLSACMLPLGYVVYRLKPLATRPAGWSWLLLPASWVISEWLRSVGFSLFLYGQGATIGDYWNFGSLGLGLMSTPFGYLSRWIGLYGLSFVAVLVAIGLGRGWRDKQYFKPFFIILMVGLLSLGTYFYTNWQNSRALTARRAAASVLQRNLELAPDYATNTPVQNYDAIKKQLILLPEYSEAFDPGASSFAHKFVSQRLAVDGVSIDVDRGSAQQWYGTLEFRDASGHLIHHDTKQLLIPTGEYLPAIVTSFYRLTGQQAILTRFDSYRRVYKGSPPMVYHTSTLTIGPVACSGILGRPIYQKLTRDGATVLTNSASLVDFNGSRSYFRQSLMMARFHAIANNRPFIQSTRGAPAFALDNNGHYLVKPASHDTRLIDFSFQPLTTKTVYTRFGEWPLIFSFGLLFGYAARQTLRRRLK